MKHHHRGPLHRLCPHCFDEIQDELRARRAWGYILGGFTVLLLITLVIVLFVLGTPR